MSRRLVLGPFNRVEGDLEVRLDITDGVVVRADVVTPLYRGFEQMLLGRSGSDALVLAPRICGICSLSQSLAVAAALRAVDGLSAAENGVLAANIAHGAENAADHLTHFYLFFMPDVARTAYADRPWYADAAARFTARTGTAAAAFLPLRARLLHIMGLLVGKWPHSLAIQPGGTTKPIDLGEKMRLLAILAELRQFLETTLFADRLEHVAEISDGAGLARWQQGRGGDFAHFLALADDLDFAQLGRWPANLLSVGAYASAEEPLFAAGILTKSGQHQLFDPSLVREEVSHAWWQADSNDPAQARSLPDADRPDAYSWCKAPRLSGAPMEVGALARQAVDGQPLIRDLLARDGVNVRLRIIARLIELARLIPAMIHWAKALRPAAPFLIDQPRPGQGAGVGLVEAARGSLGHWVGLQNDRIGHYQIIAPTSWNFSPRDDGGQPGPLEQALVGTVVGLDGAGSVAIQHIVRSFDPCMVCTAH